MNITISLHIQALSAQPTTITASNNNKTTYGRCVEYGIDYNGYDIDKIENVKHWKDCAFLCNDYISSSFWTWHLDDDNKCILKTSDNGRQHDTHCLSCSYTCLSDC